MATVPTGRLERELRALYARWVMGLPRHQHDIAAYIEEFRRDSLALTARLGGEISRMGVAADFPAPKELELDLVAGKVYSEMQTAAVRASIASGLNSRAAARAMMRAGMDQSYRKLERIARTETVRAYWKNQWDEVEQLDGLVMLWSSEESKRTCDYCLSRDGLVVEDKSIRDHPNGRCTLAPTLASLVDYKGTLDRDGSVYQDPKWSKTARKKASKEQEKLGPLATEATSAPGSFGADWDIDSPTTLKRAATAEAERERLTALKKTLDRDTVDSVKYYVGSGYGNINRYLRNPEGMKLAGSMADDIAGMDRALAAGSLAQETTVFRAVTTFEGGWDPSAMRVGDMFADAAYLSTSTSRAALQDVLRQTGGDHQAWTFVIRAPAGTPAVAGSVYESELILGRGAIQRVAEIDPLNRIIYTEVQP